MKFRFLFAFRLFPSKFVDHYSDGSVACHVTSRSKRVKSDVESYHQMTNGLKHHLFKLYGNVP